MNYCRPLRHLRALMNCNINSIQILKKEKSTSIRHTNMINALKSMIQARSKEFPLGAIEYCGDKIPKSDSRSLAVCKISFSQIIDLCMHSLNSV